MMEKNVDMDIDTLIRQEIIEHYQTYYRLAFSYTHNEQDALDIVQEGAYKAILKSSLLSHPEYVRTWIYRIMVNEALSYIRKYRKPVIDLDADQDGREDPFPDFDLRDAVERLQEPDRTIVKLRFYEDLSLKDIAFILQENVSTVKSRLYRSMKKLRLSFN